MRLIVAALVACACLAAPKGPSSWPIEKIEIEGLHAYTREQVLPVLGLKTGQHASGKDFNAARDRLLASGAFESAGYRYAPAPSKKGYLVTFQVVEAAPRFPVRFEDLPADELKAALKRSDPFFGPEIPATQPLLDRYAKTVEEYLAAHGSPGKIAGRVEPEDNGTLVVMFRPEGARPVVAGVKFTGNVVVPSTALENAINGVAIGVPYKESRFRQLLDTQVRPLYEARGRVRVAFPEVSTAPDPSVKGLIVTVKVDEGASYTIGGIEIAGTGLPAADLRKLASTYKPGDVFSNQAVEAAAAKAEGRMKQAGYLHAKSIIERKIDDKAKKVDVAIRVEPGARYTFGKLTIDGLDILTEPAIRKMWGLKPGEPFNAEYPEYFLAHVREEGIFENLGETKSTIAPDDENRTVDVKLSFKGEPPKPKKRGEPERGRAQPDTMPGP
ncbi:MAG: POTRA domain-containing protein [Acidobacteriota bacterium]